MYKSEKLNSIQEWLEWSDKIVTSAENQHGLHSGTDMRSLEPKEFPVVSVLDYEIDYYCLGWYAEHVYDKDLLGTPSSLVSDDAGHWYVCPDNKQGMANQYFREMDWFWREGYKMDNTEEPDYPEWLIPLSGGPESVKFTNWSERNV